MVKRSDEAIKKDVVKQLYWDDRVDASNIKVAVGNSEVTLTGKVPSYSVRNNAYLDAFAVTGVDKVLNKTSVEYLVSVPSDIEIKEGVETILDLQPSLEKDKIEVKVEGGIVILEGTVDSLWKKSWVENHAQDVRGVVDITNKLAVVPTEDIVDETISEDIIAALTRNKYVNPDDIDIRVKNGKVTLQGEVSSWTERNAAYSSALYTLGVKEVKDGLTVAPIS